MRPPFPVHFSYPLGSKKGHDYVGNLQGYLIIMQKIQFRMLVQLIQFKASSKLTRNIC